MGGKKVSVSIEFTSTELVHLQRFFNRGVACARGRCSEWCQNTGVYAEYHVLIQKKISEAIVQAKLAKAILNVTAATAAD